MKSAAYQYTFAGSVSLEEVQASMLLAVFAAESLHGETQMLLDGAHTFDQEARRLVVDATTEIGRDLNRVFFGFLRREFGPEAFSVSRIPQSALNTASA